MEQHLLQRERKGCENKTSNKKDLYIIKMQKKNPFIRKLRLECEIKFVSHAGKCPSSSLPVMDYLLPSSEKQGGLTALQAGKEGT